MAAIRYARSRIRDLTEAEALELLEFGSRLGRIAGIIGGEIVIVPVNYLCQGNKIVIRSRRGGLIEQLQGEPVVFEVDDHRSFDQTGWSVIVHGLLHRLDEPEGLETLRRGPLQAWAWPDAEVWYGGAIHRMTGRRVFSE